MADFPSDALVLELSSSFDPVDPSSSSSSSELKSASVNPGGRGIVPAPGKAPVPP